ncbi:hypothetical protein MFIFM68171_00888 [Madurella fahalii]|uniref:C2H2-type domain-containing protein n=1 Tax=Madurella fahalii TaxID=1157608 RepID=A0ABQ0FYV7_9PEZI
MPNNKNPEGGADTFPRIKSHIFRNHDPFIRCPNCWKACKTEDEAREHEGTTRCIRKASPGKYWMTREQQEQVRGRKFMGNSVENWYCLFGILLPDVPALGPNGYKKLSPYYVSGPLGPPTPASSATGSGRNKSIAGAAASSSDQSPGSTLPSAQGLMGSQSFHDSGPQALPSPSQALPGNHDFSCPDFAQGFDNDPVFRLIDWERSNAMFDNIPNINVSGTYATTTEPPIEPAPTATRPSHQTPTPPDANHSSSSGQGGTEMSPYFLRQDNERLWASNVILRDESAMWRGKHSRLQAQLDELLHQLRPLEDALQALEDALQALLYLPAVRERGDDEVAGRLFDIMKGLLETLVSFGSGPRLHRRITVPHARVLGNLRDDEKMHIWSLPIWGLLGARTVVYGITSREPMTMS